MSSSLRATGEPNVPGSTFPGPVPPLFDTSYMDMSSSSLFGTAAATASGSSTAEKRWVQRQLAAYEPEYIQMQGCTASLVTFNVGCKKPPLDLTFVLGSGVASARDRAAPDLVVIGLQEVDMSAAAMLREETEAAAPWIAAVQTALQISVEDPAYRMVAHRQLVGLMIIVCCKTSSMPQLRSVRVATIATGALGAVGNKGGIGCRLTFRRSTLCFIVCHLAAHQNAVGKRNQDIAQILSSLNLAEPDPTGMTVAVNLPTSHDLCFVLGDLNYRVGLTYEQACDLAAKGDVKALLKEDQLVKELGQLHTPWKGFIEFTPTFLPTYRYDIGTDRYDTSEKKRIPSYTDRILYRARDDLHSRVELATLEATMSVRSSDHKPVVARVNIPVKEDDPVKKAAVQDRLDKIVVTQGLDHVSAASVACSATVIDFGTVSYFRRSRATIELTNRGSCVAEVHLARRCAEDITDGAWLRLQPSTTVTILPGHTASIDIFAVIDWLSLRWSVGELPFQGAQRRAASTFLMACVVDGPAIAIQCSCEIELGCMGSTLDGLVSAGIVPCDTAFGATKGDAPPPPMVPVVAKELWYLVDVLSRGASPKTPDLFDGSADQDEVARVLQHINSTNGQIDLTALSATPEAAAAGLTLLLRDLQLAVIPPTHHAAAILAGRSGTAPAVMAVVRSLPVNHHNTLLYLIAFGRFLLRPDNADASGLTPDDLAAQWAPILFALSPASRPIINAGRDATAGAYDVSAGGGVAGAAAAANPDAGGKAALSRRQELEAEMEAAAKFVHMLLAGRPEMSAP